MIMEWSNEKYLDFIRDYRKSEVLWDIRNSNYKNNKIKRYVLFGLAKKYHMEEKMIKKKIKNLRSAFHREHHRLTKNVSGFKQESKKWFAYDSLKFILDVTELRTARSSKNNKTSDKEIDMLSLAQKRQKVGDVKTDLTIPTNVSIGTPQGEMSQILQSSDEFEIYGTYVASQLRQLSVEQGVIARDKIQTILTQSRLHDIRNIQNRFSSPNHHSFVPDNVEVIYTEPHDFDIK